MSRYSGEHVVSVAEYEWIIGTRWKWTCAGCGWGTHGYTTEEGARKHADEHPAEAVAYAAMWDGR